MTSSDKRMDRALEGLPILAPGCSAWRAIDARLDALESRARVRKLCRYSGALAASVLIAVLAFGSWHAAQEGMDELQRIVDTAIRDARPDLMFSSHRYSGDSPALDALLVNAAPRGAAKGRYIGDAAQDGEKTESGVESASNEF
ncbi:MAG: hypothetical protein WC997_15335 [Porticoccaceae bacterium]